MTTHTKHIIEADLEQSIIIDPLDVMVTLAADIICQDCGKPADMIGTGHRRQHCPPVEPPPPWFKCAACHLRWHTTLADYLAAGYLIQCDDCEAVFYEIDEFSMWRPV